MRSDDVWCFMAQGQEYEENKGRHDYTYSDVRDFFTPHFVFVDEQSTSATRNAAHIGEI